MGRKPTTSTVMLDSAAPSNVLRARCACCGLTASLDLPASISIILSWSESLLREHQRCAPVATPSPTAPPLDDRTVALVPLLGMPRRRDEHGRVVVDGSRPGGVVATFRMLNVDYELEMPASFFDGEPCNNTDDLEAMVRRELREVDGILPVAVSLQPMGPT